MGRRHDTRRAGDRRAAQAFAALAGTVEQPVIYQRRAAYLEYVPTAVGATLDEVEAGNGYGHVLAWVLSPKIDGDAGQWEALVDANTGDVLALQDLNHYLGGPAQRNVQGGVLPVTNDGVPPDGVEQAGWPMPWADLTVQGDTVFTDAGGNLPFCSGAAISTSLDGQFMRMNDNCGPISESTTGQHPRPRDERRHRLRDAGRLRLPGQHARLALRLLRDEPGQGAGARPATEQPLARAPRSKPT